MLLQNLELGLTTYETEISKESYLKLLNSLKNATYVETTDAYGNKLRMSKQDEVTPRLFKLETFDSDIRYFRETSHLL